MPAIYPARLRKQVAMVAEHFDQPAAFVRSLHHLLEFYADRAHRPGKSGEPAPLLDAYNVRPPVLREIVLGLAPSIKNEPDAGLALCDALWEQEYLEFRILAVKMLGLVPPQATSQDIVKRVDRWAKEAHEEQIKEILLNEGLASFRKEESEQFFRLVKNWLESESPAYQSLGLSALLPVIADSDFKNLPLFFRMSQPFCRVAPASIRPAVLDLLAALANRSPQETAFFLRQTLEMPNSPDTAWLIRHVVTAFPEEFQEGLRAAARGR
jgi:hypothetical protein